MKDHDRIMVAHLIRVHNQVKVYDITKYFDMALVVFQVEIITVLVKSSYVNVVDIKRDILPLWT